MRGKITKRAVDALKPSARDSFLWDTEVRGFGCKVTPKGGRIYLLQYGRNRRDYRITIGRHGVDYTAEQARIEALRLRGVVASGENPAIGRMRNRSASTVAELGEWYMTEYAAAHKKPSAIAQDRRNLDNHIVPLIGRLSISAVERADISRVMRDVATGKTKKDEKTTFRGRRIVRGGEIVANRVQALLSKMFELAEEWKLRPEGTNPCRGVKHYAENKVERFLSTDELARLGAALIAAEQGELLIEEVDPAAPPIKKKRGGQKKFGPRSEKPSVVAAIRLLLFTGCGVGEILSLRWSDVHLERKLLLLPDSKTGAKAVYLSEAAIQVLVAISRKPNRDYVLEGNNPGQPILSLRKPWLHLCAAAKLDNLRLHDLRHSFASFGAAGGLSFQMIGALLGHTQPATTARYAHLAASPLHEAANAIGAKMLSAMTPNTST
jgi:integrase